MKKQPVLLSIPDRSKAKELAQWVKKNWGSTQADWLRRGKFDLQFTEIKPYQGLIIPYWNKQKHKYHFRLCIDTNLSKNDQRFVIAHEIAHSFFYCGKPKKRTLPVYRLAKGETNPEEQWCDWFAEELTRLKPPKV